MRTARFRVQRRDRPWLDAHVNALFGPFTMPSVDVLRDAVSRLAHAHPLSRLDSHLEGRRRYWELGRSAESIVSEGVWDDSPSLGERFDAMDHDQALLSPLALIRYPNYLGMRVSHGMGDGGILKLVLSGVMHTSTTGELVPWPPLPTGRFPLFTAALRTFGRHPGMIRSALADRYRQDIPAGPPVHRPWAPARRSAAVCISRVQREEMACWAQRFGPGSTHFSLLVSAVLRAVNRAGLAVAPDVNVIVDLRRYLKAGWIDGNFIANVPMRLDFQTAPPQIAAAVKTTMRSGRPLANQVLSSLRSGTAAPAPTTADVHLLPQVTFSHVGEIPQVDRLPVMAQPDLMCIGSVEPGGPHGVTFLFVDLPHSTWISVSFHGNVIDAALLEQALKLVADDPVALLSESVEVP
jgi:hypothetical protein